MGTRADFYVGRGAGAEWIGSVAFDGYPDGPGVSDAAPRLIAATSEKAYRRAVADLLATRDDATKPEQGWPWPWDDSRTTDYAYAFDGGKVWISCFGHGWLAGRNTLRRLRAMRDDPDADGDLWSGPKVAFPDMSARRRFTLGKRSGMIVLGGEP